jgi:probable HAF family extracellular repeat protein
MKKTVIFALFVAGVLGFVQTVQAAPKYILHQTGFGYGSKATAVNDLGQAVVNYNNRAYLWNFSGGLTDLDDLGGGKSFAYGINNQGQVVGESYINTTNKRAFLWQGGVMQDLGALNGDVNSSAKSINNQGQVVGYSEAAGGTQVAFLWTQAGGLMSLDLQGGAANKIIDNGNIAGYNHNHAYLWTAPGSGQDLGVLTGTYNFYWGNDANLKGQVVGAAEVEPNSMTAPRRAFLWTQATGMIDIGGLGGTRSKALGINNRGYIVGWSDHAGLYDDPGCLWIPGEGVFDLNNLVINKPAEVFLRDAGDISETGWIVGKGTNGAYLLQPLGAFSANLLLLLE